MDRRDEQEEDAPRVLGVGFARGPLGLSEQSDEGLERRLAETEPVHLGARAGGERSGEVCPYRCEGVCRYHVVAFFEVTKSQGVRNAAAVDRDR